MSFGHLGAATIIVDYYLWGVVKDMCYADKPETIDALKDNTREALVKYSCTQSIMCLKIESIVKVTAWPAESAIWMKLFSIIRRGLVPSVLA